MSLERYSPNSNRLKMFSLNYFAYLTLVIDANFGMAIHIQNPMDHRQLYTNRQYSQNPKNCSANVTPTNVYHQMHSGELYANCCHSNTILVNHLSRIINSCKMEQRKKNHKSIEYIVLFCWELPT